MKKYYIPFLILFLVFSSLNCSSQKVIRLAKTGNVTQTNYSTKIPFRYENKHIFIDVYINGTKYNFLFDSGADFCIIDINHIKNVDYKIIKVVKNSGSSFKTQKSQLVEISKFVISEIDFNDIGAAIMDLSFINNDYPCSDNPIAGVIGATLLRKTNWQIDYVNRKILFSDSISNFSISKNSHQLEMIYESWGSPKINVNINGINKNFIFDTGSGGKITTGNEFLQELDSISTIGINKEDKLKNPYINYVIRTNNIKIGSILLENHTISLEDGVSSLIGNEFLENFILTFDWNRKMVILEPIKELIAKPNYDFEITLKPNYTTNKIQITGVYHKKSTKNNFIIGTDILKINEFNVSNLSKVDLCNFWGNDWEKIRLNDTLIIETKNGKVELVKMNLFLN